jgi:hypothetical protein
MKCICGYEHQSGYNEDTGNWEYNLIGDKPFIQSELKILYQDHYYDQKIKTIFICPKCGTLKIYL